MTKSQLLKKIAILETIDEQLSAEAKYVDHLMNQLNFSEGLLKVKPRVKSKKPEKKPTM